MTEIQKMVIVGAGLAGVTAAQALRDHGFDGAVVLIGDETEPPYERPALSKEYLQNRATRESMFVHPESWYADQDIDLRLGVPVTGVDRDRRTVTLDDRSQLRYSKLLLTTGSAPRRLPIPGADLDGVHYLRTLADSDRIRSAFETAERVAIIGGGWIGLETAAAARAAGADVTVVEAGKLPLQRPLGTEVAQIFADLHRRHGVQLRCGVQVTAVADDQRHGKVVRMSDGSHVTADTVIIGGGITPNTQLADAAGLKIDNGVWVDEHLRTSDENIYAAGDVANAYHPLLGRHLRVEHWANALHQPPIAAAAMLGDDAVYDRLPYFFTDQYELSMEYAGYAEPGGYDQIVVRGDVDRLEFIAFWLHKGRLLAGMNVNTWDVTDTIQTLIRSGRPINTSRLGDPETPLESLIA